MLVTFLIIWTVVTPVLVIAGLCAGSTILGRRARRNGEVPIAAPTLDVEFVARELAELAEPARELIGRAG